ncbi:fumarylacetoacetate hydrolase family protein [Limnohabitans sp.]|uniref:fumarylacetoacetate hydrolase family protein n=1 Tax=Limnohabitans sp. TaxID=1907725 RepID=UPI0037C05A2E
MNHYAVQVPSVVSVPVDGVATPFPVRRIYCVGRNYLEHIREMKESDERDPPFFFQKPRDAIVLSGQGVPYPPQTDDFQFEVELVVAIGKAGRSVSKEKALEHVFGYAVGFDMTRRDRQRESGKNGLPWEIGKSFDGSAPCGNLRTVAEVGHIQSGRIAVSVNGQSKQDSVIEKMIWNVPEIVSNLSHLYDLAEGDLIYTGTPAGVAPVLPGDILRGSVQGLSDLEITIVVRS